MKINLLLTIGLLLSINFSAKSQNLAKIERDAQTTMKYKEYSTAIELYEQLVKADPDNLEYNYQLGVCHLNSPSKKQALERLEKVYKSNPNYKTDLEFMLGQAYHYQANFEEAKEHYNKAKTNYENAQSSVSNLKGKEKEEKIAYYNKQAKLSEKKAKECENGVKYYEKAKKAGATIAHIENMGKSVNSEYGDYTPIVPESGEFMIFTSRRDGTTGGKRDFGDDKFFEDIYMVNNQGGNWGGIKNLNINKKYHDAAAAISADGKTLYLYRDNPKTKGDLYVSNYLDDADEWSEPKKLNDNINTKHQETSLSISEDGNTIYFASDRPGGFGGLDLYMSKKGPDGEWGSPTNLGKGINTEYSEDSPFISFDGKTLYFSSEGHDNIGGFDIFKAKGGEGNWSNPENLGYPVNGPDDDMHLVLSRDNKRGFFVSDEDTGFGDKDIYVLTAPKSLLEPLDASGLTPITLSPDTTDTSNEVDFLFEVLFGFDQSSLRPKSVESVESLLKYLQDNPSVRIEVGGHTCNIGSKAYNQALSVRRARAVANYLIEKGIEPNRIEVKGYNFEKPAVPNDTPTNRAANRRAEFDVLDK